jgi:hypothetical protein
VISRSAFGRLGLGKVKGTELAGYTEGQRRPVADTSEWSKKAFRALDGEYGGTWAHLKDDRKTVVARAESNP